MLCDSCRRPECSVAYWEHVCSSTSGYRDRAGNQVARDRADAQVSLSSARLLCSVRALISREVDRAKRNAATVRRRHRARAQAAKKPGR